MLPLLLERGVLISARISVPGTPLHVSRLSSPVSAMHQYNITQEPYRLHITGSWVGDTPERDSYWRDFAIQTSEITCEKKRGICLEARAIWKPPVMLAELIEYKIHEWTSERVLAALDGAAATIELKFDLKAEQCLLTHTERPELPHARKLPTYAHLADGKEALQRTEEKGLRRPQ